jgi:hypothetical protein
MRGKETDRENERRGRKSERQNVAKKGCDVSHKLDCWSSFQQLKNLIILAVHLNSYQDSRWQLSLSKEC